MSDREHFEAWLRRRFPRGEIHVSNGEYEHQTTQHQYEAFVAGMAVKQADVDALRKAHGELRLAAIPPGHCVVKDEPVASVLPGALKRYPHDKDPEHWCHEALLYSPNNPSDGADRRVKLYAPRPGEKHG